MPISSWVHNPACHPAAITPGPFEDFVEFGFAVTLLLLFPSFVLLYSHYRSNDYDRTRWLLITWHSWLIDNVGVFGTSLVLLLSDCNSSY